MIYIVEMVRLASNPTVKGYIEVPDTIFNPSGFITYIRDTRPDVKSVKVYSANKVLTKDDYKELDDLNEDLLNAARSIKYYPATKENNLFRAKLSTYKLRNSNLRYKQNGRGAMY